MINIPSDLRKNKEKIVGEMDLRETVCLFLALILAIGILYYVRVVIGYRNLAVIVFLLIPFVLPFLAYGFKRINGMRIDDYIKVFINNNILANKERLNVQATDDIIVKENKYELIRYYKLINKNELIRLRQHLKDNKKLILTEYVDYNNENISIFRLDGKDLILTQIKRNKEAIEYKKKQIKKLKKDIIVSIEEKLIKSNSGDAISKSYIFTRLFLRIYKCIIYRTRSFSLQKKDNDKLYSALIALKNEQRYLQHKSFNDLKEEIDIFEDLPNVVAKRIMTSIDYNKKSDANKNTTKNKISNNANQNIVDDILVLRKNIKSDNRTLYQLHLFDKENFRQIIENSNDKIVFINNNDKVDVYTFDLNLYLTNNILDDAKISTSNASEIVIDINIIDKTLGLYEGTILSLEARNFYNHYREINNLTEIL